MNFIENFKELVEKNFDPFKYNQNIEFEDFKTNLKHSMKYYENDIKIGTDLLKKYFIIDVRTLPKEKIKYIFDNFEEIQRIILSDYFLDYHDIEIKNTLSTYPFNLELIFLINKEENYNIDKYKFLYNMDYALKSFMTEDELLNLLNKEYTFKNIDNEKLLKLKDRVIKLNHFNYIQGNNGTGKTKILNEISKQLYVPVFSMNDLGLNLEREIENIDSLKSIIYNLTDNYELDKCSDYGKYIYRLSQILQFSKEHNNIVLLDDLRWNSLDSRNKIKLINTLADYSYEYNPIVLTGYEEGGLIKKKVYKSNIILSNEK